MMHDSVRATALCAPLVVLTCLSACASSPRENSAGAAEAVQAARLVLEPCPVEGVPDEVRCGTYEVYEDRAAQAGRRIPLHVVVLPARNTRSSPDPVFVLGGGPGQAATDFAPWVWHAWFRAEREVVLVDQRGTGRSNPLHCRLAGSAQNPQGYLDDIFQLEMFRACRNELERHADLRLYTTPLAMADLDEVRRALGYRRINLVGGSYGSRAALIYLRQHGETVRSVILNGAVPPALTNPLHHAQDAQAALDLLLDECTADPHCGSAFPALRDRLATVLQRLETQPAHVELPYDGGNGSLGLVLTRGAFAEALRVMTYNAERSRSVPLLIERAYHGDLRPFAQQALDSNRGLREQLHFGMLLSVVCSEDIPRIDPGDIPRLTRGTVLGDARVRQQMAVCSTWPHGEVGAEYAEPVRSDLPVLILSGTMDPVTPPRWGEETARHLPNSLHVVAPGAHGVAGDCLVDIQQRFLTRAALRGLDASCVRDLRLGPFTLPEGRAAGR